MNGITEQFIFDTGSSGSFTANNAFLDKLKLGNISIDKKTKKIDNNTNKRKIRIKHLKISGIYKKDIELTIEENVSLLIGNDFLENYMVTIDWENNNLYLERTLN